MLGTNGINYSGACTYLQTYGEITFWFYTLTLKKKMMAMYILDCCVCASGGVPLEYFS
jgi:hypothetical protein